MQDVFGCEIFVTILDFLIEIKTVAFFTLDVSDTIFLNS